MEKKFIDLLENTMTRYTRGGFLVGDYVKFKKGFEKEDFYKRLGSNVVDLIKQMIDSGLHIRVVGIKNQYPAIYPGNEETANGLVAIDLALDNMGGRYSHHVTVDPCCLERIEYYPNLAPIPDSVVAADKTTYSGPEEYKRDGKKTETTHIKGGNYELPTKDTKNKHAKEPYTANYLTGLK